MAKVGVFRKSGVSTDSSAFIRPSAFPLPDRRALKMGPEPVSLSSTEVLRFCARNPARHFVADGASFRGNAF